MKNELLNYAETITNKINQRINDQKIILDMIKDTKETINNLIEYPNDVELKITTNLNEIRIESYDDTIVNSILIALLEERIILLIEKLVYKTVVDSSEFSRSKYQRENP
jgi:hypothetical protein